MANEIGLSTISRSAEKLGHTPLGIISLLILLVYGVAGLVLGIGKLPQAENEPLIWFLVLFPVLVLLVFSWLLACHHEKLYPPNDYLKNMTTLLGVTGETPAAEKGRKKSKPRSTSKKTKASHSSTNPTSPL